MQPPVMTLPLPPARPTQENEPAAANPPNPEEVRPPAGPVLEEALTQETPLAERLFAAFTALTIDSGDQNALQTIGTLLDMPTYHVLNIMVAVDLN